MIGNNSCGVHSLMARHGPPTTSRSWRSSPTTARGCAVGRDHRRRAASASSPPAGAGARSTRSCATARPLRGRDPRALPEHPAPRLRLQPRRSSCRRTASTSPGAGRAREGTCVTVLEATLQAGPQPAGPSLLVLGYPDIYEAADHVPEILEASPIGLEGHRRHAGRRHEEEGHPSARRCKLLPDGARLAAGRVRRRHQGGGRRRRRTR